MNLNRTCKYIYMYLAIILLKIEIIIRVRYFFQENRSKSFMCSRKTYKYSINTLLIIIWSQCYSLIFCMSFLIMSVILLSLLDIIEVVTSSEFDQDYNVYDVDEEENICGSRISRFLLLFHELKRNLEIWMPYYPYINFYLAVFSRNFGR